MVLRGVELEWNLVRCFLFVDCSVSDLADNLLSPKHWERPCDRYCEYLIFGLLLFGGGGKREGILL